MLFQPIVSWTDGLGRVLAGISALGALYAFVSTFGAEVPAEAGWLAIWQSWGFAMFAALFTLLALRPRASAGLWELAIFHKAAVGIAGMMSPGLPGAVEAGTFDAVLALVLAAAYVLTKGWRGWQAG